MSAIPDTATIPLFTDPDGAVRVRGTRVTLDSIITAFRAGATAEEIAQQFPRVALADAYLIIAHYLNHTTDIDSYLFQREAEAASLKRQVEARFDPAGVRDRLIARRNAERSS